MNLPQTAGRNSKASAEGKAKRARLLALVLNEFTSKKLAEAANIKYDAARALVQKMLMRREVVATSDYKTPRIYRKVI